MCDFSTGFKFCTCEDFKQNTTDIPYIWQLTRWLGNKETNMMGSIIGPSDSLGDGLTIELVLEKLNTGNCFDFEYIPQENDQLQINYTNSENEYSYMSVKYNHREWKEGMNSKFTSITKKLNEGYIRKMAL
jgi:hypothetical protein